MPECAPASTHPGQEGLREAGFRAKTGLEEPHGQRSPVTCIALDAKHALCSPSLGFGEAGFGPSLPNEGCVSGFSETE